MDSNWFYSAMAQSAAAITGIISAFIIAKIINDLSKCEKHAIEWDELGKKLETLFHWISSNNECLIENIRVMRQYNIMNMYKGIGGRFERIKEIQLNKYFDNEDELNKDIEIGSFRIDSEKPDETKIDQLSSKYRKIDRSLERMKLIDSEIGYMQKSVKMIFWIIISNAFLFVSCVFLPLIMIGKGSVIRIILAIIFLIIFIIIQVIMIYYNNLSRLDYSIYNKYKKFSNHEKFRKLLWRNVDKTK